MFRFNTLTSDLVFSIFFVMPKRGNYYLIINRNVCVYLQLSIQWWH